jgi:uncharacterized iron-regulated membrane protein
MTPKNWFSLHHWAGFHLSLLLSFVLLTGTFATISTDLDWLANSAVRAEYPVSDDQALNWPALLTRINYHFPETKIEIDSINRPNLPWHNVEVIARDIKGERFRIYLDAYDHRMTGQGDWLNWQRFFRQVHRHLMLPTKLGITIVGSLGLAMLLLFVTSFYIYRHWWRYFFAFDRIKSSFHASKLVPATTLRKEASTKRRFWAELHKLIGLWSLWLMLIISVTGTWYLAEKWGAGASYPTIENTSKAISLTNTASPSSVALSKAVEYIATNHPQYIINKVRFIADKHVIEIDGQEHALLVRDRANKKVFDSLSGEYIGGRQGDKLNWHFRISEAADPLHFGTFSNWIYRYVWFVFGLALSFLSFSGIYMYFLRLRQTGQLKNLEGKNSFHILWLKTHWVKWPCLTLLLICINLVIYNFFIL